MKLLIFSIFRNIICEAYEQKSTDNDDNTVKIHLPAFLFENTVGKTKITLTIDIERENKLNENIYEEIDNDGYMIMTGPKPPPIVLKETPTKVTLQRSFSDVHSYDIGQNDTPQSNNSSPSKTFSFSGMRSFMKKKSSKNNKSL
ncbi:hypothetical protein NBO_29g0042 [Nosema bombycis CQ1]|uniref:Uncharacterized protein n=1 Tax=Nosema bombycis (strain CQ1 / CVCC 102059) TaxID=578461 RepID=R0MJI1_NOSB1|nr:hypothetical protein NBO_29g0042 [Nosema bombycis CQ1]|eukprot:EOB14360.1 hypothetical protein NBO_29g0042 [Nosema bombycis CQ1]